MNLVIDIGNTVAKLAVFDKEEVVEVLRGSNHSLDCLTMLCNKYPIEKIIASVITLSNTIRKQLAKQSVPFLELTYRTPVPIENLYKTPETLGMDRLAAVVGANYLCPNRDLLVIDAGTALTYEFIDAKGHYWGRKHFTGYIHSLQGLERVLRQTSFNRERRRLPNSDTAPKLLYEPV